MEKKIQLGKPGQKGSRVVTANGQGLKLGGKKKFQSAGELDKGEARKLRKALRKEGFGGHASTRRGG